MKSEVSIIVAMDRFNVIADGYGDIPWNIHDDMKHFKETTMSHPVIMGRKTWDSIPDKYRPLPGRLNIVVTRRASALQRCQFLEKPFLVADSIECAIAQARFVMPESEIFITGGAQIYEHALKKNLVDRAIVSEIKATKQIINPLTFPWHLMEDWEFEVLDDREQFMIIEYTKKK